MTLDQWISELSALMSFIGLVFVAVQMRDATRQRRLEALYQIYDVNRQLLSSGFDHPELFKILTDDKNADPQMERRYLQMWLNQLSLIHTHLNQGGFGTEFHEGLHREIEDFFSLRNMRHHWRLHGSFYPQPFQSLVDAAIEKLEAGHEART